VDAPQAARLLPQTLGIVDVKWTRIIIAVIASIWFLPISCSGTLFAGIHLIAKLDARDVKKGDSVHRLSSFVVEPGQNGEPFMAVPLSELINFKEKMASSLATGKTSFLLSRPNAQITSNESRFSYKVIEESPSGQLIEVIEAYLDGDNTIWSRYKATQSSITPISSKMFYFGYMFEALPYAFGFSLFVYGIGRFLKHKNRALEISNGDS
jgi:hypothetical protein